ncbi:MAG: hypothetical protein RLZZ500_2577 [Bacteroidota bacterium]
MKLKDTYKELVAYFLTRWIYFVLVVFALVVQYVLFPISFDAFAAKHENYYPLFYCFTVFYSFDFGFQRNLIRTRQNLLLPYLIYTFIGYVVIFYLSELNLFECLVMSCISTCSHVLSFYKYANEVADRPNRSVLIRIFHIIILYLAFLFSSDLWMFGIIYFILHAFVSIYFIKDLFCIVNFTDFYISKSQFFFLSINIIYFFGNVMDKFIYSGTVLNDKGFIVLNESLSYTLSAVNIMIPLVVFNVSFTAAKKSSFFSAFFPVTILLFLAIYLILGRFFSFRISFNIYFISYALAILLNASNSFTMLVPKETGYSKYFIASVLPTFCYFILLLLVGEVSLNVFLIFQILKLLVEFTLRNLFLRDYETKN